MRTNPGAQLRRAAGASTTSARQTRCGRRSIALACAVVTAAVLCALPVAQGADSGVALYGKLARDPVPVKLRGGAQVQVLDIPADERSMGLVGSILVNLPDKAHVRYFVFDTRDNAAKGYRRYVKAAWGGPMRRLAQDEFAPKQNIAPGVVTCELQRNESTRLYVSACLHLHATLPVLTRSTLPVKFNDSVKFNDADVQQARYMAAAADSIEIAGQGTLHVEKIARP